MTVVELQSLVNARIKASVTQVAEFCKRWKITELALFGSVLRDDFHSDSDIDVLVTFAAEQRLTWDDWIKIRKRLKPYFNARLMLFVRNI